MVVRVVMLVNLLLLANTAAFAAHPLITDDTGTQGKGRVHLEINGEFYRDEAGGTEENSAEIGATLSFGAADSLDVVLGVPYLWIRLAKDGSTILKENGVSDLSIEIKWRFLDHDTFSLALKPGISLPTGKVEEGLGAGRVGYSIFLISTFTTGPLSIHANLGYDRNENDSDERKNLWHVSAAAGYVFTEKIEITGNIGIERNTDRNMNRHPAFVLGGLIFSLSEDVDIDIGFKAGLNEPETEHSLLAGLAWKF